MAFGRGKKAGKADAAKPDKSGEGSREAQNESFKKLLWALLALNVIAAGSMLWLRFDRVRKSEIEARSAESQLLRLRQTALTVKTEAERIEKDRVERVGQPGELVQKVARALGIADKIDVRNGNPSRFRRSDLYNEIPITISFLELRGYDMKGIYTFLAELERANSKVQVVEVNFGDRDDPTADGKVFWRPTDARIRVFVPRDSGT